MTDALIAPHGGTLIVNQAVAEEQAELRERARSLPRVVIGSRQIADLEMLAVGAFSPLNGFLLRADYLSVLNTMRLANGLPWSIPVTLSTSTEQAAQLKEGEQIALVDVEGTLYAVLQLQEKYSYDKQLEARQVYRTTEEAHPGVQVLYQQG
ncbi:MAG TPA: sulfate adenylyltransferase, partial [Ktedonobacteraceae bacterium]|nr:sulfate adenylyltransferase [Ktedonobacteraceae bacterium]